MLGIAKDPVCKAKVKKSTRYKWIFNSRVFYFDSAACKGTFKGNPHQFIGDKNKKSFLERLAEASDGKSKSCQGCQIKCGYARK
ncbi:MAG TPA: YHS domain-containing protein [candidate division CPR3 bacterium]|uniref:YHS domain-containing protein n=2 Tax=root TaxID=1 RepID=A0A7C1NST0_UNCC3|nr:YHS domain-containing protein [candidate division CPR3 bacterium]